MATDREHLEAVEALVGGRTSASIHEADTAARNLESSLAAVKHHIESQPNNSDGVEAAGRFDNLLSKWSDELDRRGRMTDGYDLFKVVQEFVNDLRDLAAAQSHIQDETGDKGNG